MWELDSDTAKIEAVNAFNLPYKPEFVRTVKSGMIDAWRRGRARGQVLIAQGRVTSRWFKARFAKIQEFTFDDPFANTFVAKAQEQVIEDMVYSDFVKSYAAWSDRLGDELWQRKTKAVKDTVIRGVENQWPLHEISHYEKDGVVVSASEATGGVGGKANVLPEYSYVRDKPGLTNEMSKNLAEYTLPGWQIERIARTEYMRAMNDGLMSTYVNDDAVVAVEFVVIEDSSLCPECAMMSGTILDMDDPRLSHYQPPIHVRGRCELYPIFAWEMRESNMDTERTTFLFDKDGKKFDITYKSSQINPDFLAIVRPANDAAGIKRQLLTVKESEQFRQGFVAPTAAERFGSWLHPRSNEKANALTKRIERI